MIDFELSPDVLGNTRFAFSPLCELGCSLRLLAGPRPPTLHRSWYASNRDRLAQLRGADLLIALAPTGRWAPECLNPPVTGRTTTIDRQLEAVARMDHQQLADELELIWEGSAPPGARDLIAAGPGGPPLLAEALAGYWAATIAPHWGRMQAVLEDDLSYRVSQVLQGGLFGLLQDIHPEVSLRPDGRVLRIVKPHHAPAMYHGSVLTLVPSIFVAPRLVVGHSGPSAFELTYAARGVARVWEDLDELAGAVSSDRSEDRLGALVGKTRAAILAQLDVPQSTTQLARSLRQSPAATNHHLKVLLKGGMLTSWRVGRSVMYRQSSLGSSVVAACADNDDYGRTG